ncbi:MAG: D-alanine--D-alanine ligase [Pseudomonadales bacterium]
MNKTIQQLCERVRTEIPGGIAVVYGGWSPEREISLQSGAAVGHALTKVGIQASMIDVDRSRIRSQLGDEFAHVFLALHGPGGEDGAIQGYLECVDVGYTGSGVLASALAMDKQRSKQLWQSRGIATADFASLDENTDWAAVLKRLNGAVFVKPCHEGSSIGMSIARNVSELQAAFATARQYDSVVLAERLIEGREFHVSILGTDVLPPVEVTTSREFYDYDAKYIENTTSYHCPVELDATETKQLMTLSMQAFQSLGCSGWGRVDVMRNASGEFFVLEVNTIPGLTDHSLVPMSAKAAGMSFEELVLRILLTAAEGYIQAEGSLQAEGLQ